MFPPRRQPVVGDPDPNRSSAPAPTVVTDTGSVVPSDPRPVVPTDTRSAIPPRRIGLRRPSAFVAGGALALLTASTVACADVLAAAGVEDRLAATSLTRAQATSPGPTTDPGTELASTSTGAPTGTPTETPTVTPSATEPAPAQSPPPAPPLAPTPAPTPTPRAPARSSVTGPAAAAGKIGIPAIPLAAYQRAASRMASCGIPWWLLAGIGKVESNHAAGGRVDRKGTVRGAIYGPRLDGTLAGSAVILDTDGGALDGDPEYDRAVGPMQFLPGTWRSVKRDGNGDRVADPQNIYDAALAAGVYLCRSGPLRDEAAMTRALWSYNGSAAYARAVLGYARAYRDAAAPPPPPAPAPTSALAATPAVTPVPAPAPSAG